jgi:hypothetical protein
MIFDLIGNQVLCSDSFCLKLLYGLVSLLKYKTRKSKSNFFISFRLSYADRRSECFQPQSFDFDRQYIANKHAEQERTVNQKDVHDRERKVARI